MKRILGILIIVSISFIVVSCDKNTFTMVWKANIPPECNMTLNVMSTYKELLKDTKTKDNTYINLNTDPCWSALKSIRCQYEAFGMNIDTKKVNDIDVTNNVRYTAFLNCLNRK